MEYIITPSDIRDLVPGTDATLDERTIRPYLQPAQKAVATIIGEAVFRTVTQMSDTELLGNLKAAIANRLMYDYKLFETIQKRQTKQADVYKYELEAMQNTYLGFYFDALDSLIKGLNDMAEPLPEWIDSPANKARAGLLIRDADEFNGYYGIDGSDYFFFASVFLQRKVIDKHLTAFPINDLPEEMLRRVKSATATLTVAYALRQFDITMLPKSIRNASADGAYRQASSEQSTMYELSDYLFSQAESELERILFDLNKPAAGADINSTNNLNKPENKFFLFT